MADTRKKNANWHIKTNDNGTTPVWDVEFALLMDLRDELQKLNRLLNCPNFTGMPGILHRIAVNTAPKKKRRLKIKRSA